MFMCNVDHDVAGVVGVDGFGVVVFVVEILDILVLSYSEYFH